MEEQRGDAHARRIKDCQAKGRELIKMSTKKNESVQHTEIHSFGSSFIDSCSPVVCCSVGVEKKKMVGVQSCCRSSSSFILQ